MLTAAGTSSCNSSRGIGTRTAYRQDRGWTSAFGGNPGLKAHVWGVSFTSLEQRGFRFTAQHARVSLGRLFERISFNHWTHAG
jgi:hypothetical protein